MWESEVTCHKQDPTERTAHTHTQTETQTQAHPHTQRHRNAYTNRYAIIIRAIIAIMIVAIRTMITLN